MSLLASASSESWVSTSKWCARSMSCGAFKNVSHLLCVSEKYSKCSSRKIILILFDTAVNCSQSIAQVNRYLLSRIVYRQKGRLVSLKWQRVGSFFLCATMPHTQEMFRATFLGTWLLQTELHSWASKYTFPELCHTKIWYVGYSHHCKECCQIWKVCVCIYLNQLASPKSLAR